MGNITSNNPLIKAATFADLPTGILSCISQLRTYTYEDDLFDQEGHLKESTFSPITVEKANQTAKKILCRYRLTPWQLHGSKILVHPAN